MSNKNTTKMKLQKNRQLPSWEERMDLFKEALSKGIERNTQKQKNKKNQNQ